MNEEKKEDKVKTNETILFVRAKEFKLKDWANINSSQTLIIYNSALDTYDLECMDETFEKCLALLPTNIKTLSLYDFVLSHLTMPLHLECLNLYCKPKDSKVGITVDASLLKGSFVVRGKWIKKFIPPQKKTDGPDVIVNTTIYGSSHDYSLKIEDLPKANITTQSPIFNLIQNSNLSNV